MLPDIFLRLLLSKKLSALASMQLLTITATTICHMIQDTSGTPLVIKPRPRIEKSQQYSETYTYFVVFKT